MEQEYKYFAFISYSSRDVAWGKRLQRRLEGWRMPATLCSERGWPRRPLKPVFFAPTDIQPGGLSDELQQRLRESRNLIVIGSPNSARSEWVGREIEYIHSLGRTANIHYFIVDGQPHSGSPDTECFHPVIDQLGIPEILGANIHERTYRWPWLNRERAYVQIVSKLLDVEFDAIWQRHRRQMVRKAVGWTLGAAAVVAALAGVWWHNQPFDTRITLTEATPHVATLPPLHDAVVTLTLDNESKTDTIISLNDAALLTNVPHRFMNQPVRITVTAPDHLSLDTTVVLTRKLSFAVNRDPAEYGHVRFMLWNVNAERPLPGVPVTVAGIAATSDADGVVTVDVPLERQSTSYRIATPMHQATDSIHTPCGDSDIIAIIQ